MLQQDNENRMKAEKLRLKKTKRKEKRISCQTKTKNDG